MTDAERIDELEATIDKLVIVVSAMQTSRDRFNDLVYAALKQALERDETLRARCQHHFEMILKIARATETRLDPTLAEAVAAQDDEAIAAALASTDLGQAH